MNLDGRFLMKKGKGSYIETRRISGDVLCGKIKHYRNCIGTNNNVLCDRDLCRKALSSCMFAYAPHLLKKLSSSSS